MKTTTLMLITLALAGGGVAGAASARSPGEGPGYLSDRGSGIPTSMFGTYVNPGDVLFYPFFEYYYDNDAEYSPQELGHELDEDFRGRYRGYEGLIFLAYGLTNSISVELEAAVIEASLETASEDPSGVPEEITESGLGDVQTQVNWAWPKETAARPELFSFLEVVYPLQKDKVLIGTSDWEFKVGSGVMRGFSWGTVIEPPISLDTGLA